MYTAGNVSSFYDYRGGSSDLDKLPPGQETCQLISNHVLYSTCELTHSANSETCFNDPPPRSINRPYVAGGFLAIYPDQLTPVTGNNLIS